MAGPSPRSRSVQEILAEGKSSKKTAEPVQKENTKTVQQLLSAPVPPKTGKRLAGHRQHLTISIDRNLSDLLITESGEKDVSVSRLVDSILWNHYGQPKLSFEGE